MPKQTINICKRSIIFLMALLILGCSLGNKKSDLVKLPPLEKIAILPMDRATTKPASERPTCNIGGNSIYTSSYVTPEAAQKATDILYSMLLSDKRFKPVSQGQCLGLLSDILQRKINSSKLRILREFGRTLDADAILYGKIYRFRERVGSDYSVKSPASVAFSLILVRINDGRVLWRYSFDQTQQALTENLFNWRFYKTEGMRWVTAEELMTYGLKQAVKELEELLS